MADHKTDSTRETGLDLVSRFSGEPSNFGIANLLGMNILSAHGGIGRVSITIDKRLMHPQQIVHGGVIFTLADTAMSMALLSLIPEGTPFGTIEAKINYLLPVRGGELLAEGSLVHKGRSTAVMEATVYNIYEGKQQAIAKVLGTFNIARHKAHESVQAHGSHDSKNNAD